MLLTIKCYATLAQLYFLIFLLEFLRQRKHQQFFLQLCVMGWFFYNSIECFDNGSNFDMFNVNGV